MARVIGIGGVFFRSKDPKKLQKWYEENLRFEPDDEGYITFRWKDIATTKTRPYTLWGPFPEDTKYMDPSSKQFMINFVVDNLDEILDHLRKIGVSVDDKIEEHQEGRFGWFVDPEGNKIELWEPPS